MPVKFWMRTVLGIWRIEAMPDKGWRLTLDGQLVRTFHIPRAASEAVHCHQTGHAKWDALGKGVWSPPHNIGEWRTGKEWPLPGNAMGRNQPDGPSGAAIPSSSLEKAGGMVGAVGLEPTTR